PLRSTRGRSAGQDLMGATTTAATPRQLPSQKTLRAPHQRRGLQPLTTCPDGCLSHRRHIGTSITDGEGHDRFDFTLALMIDGLAHR
ncbi:MAG TPA: hypothetical protein VF328_04500, partial [Mycobacterium sp.]